MEGSPLGRRIALQALLWAGPLGIGLSVLLLILAAPWFRHGPGVPTAGDPRAWGAMWGALALTAVGCVTGTVASLAWLVIAWKRKRRPSGVEWFRTALNLALGLGFAFLYGRP